MLSTIDPLEFLDGGFWEAGVITSVFSTDRFVIASGIVYTSSPIWPAFTAMAWVLDPDLAFIGQVELLLLPAEMIDANTGPAVAMFLVEDHVWSVSALQEGTSPAVPVYWLDTEAIPLGGIDFAAVRSGVPTGLSVVGAFPDATPYATGYTMTPGRSLLPRPGPYIWAGAIGAPLSTADAELLVGSGEAIGVVDGWAFVAGETIGRDPANPDGYLSVPALWTNGERQDLQPLVAPGTGPATVISLPFLGWWRLPNTPTTTLPDWPYPGGFATVRRAVPVSAAGSAVIRTLAADLPRPCSARHFPRTLLRRRLPACGGQARPCAARRNFQLRLRCSVLACPPRRRLPAPRDGFGESGGRCSARYFTQTVFTFTKARMPSSPSSRP